MNWKENISEGLRRVGLIVGFIFLFIFGIIGFWGGENSFLAIPYMLLGGVIGFFVGFGLVQLINWVINGFLGR